MVRREAARSPYDAACFSRLAAVEDRHFWFRARSKAIAALVGALATDMPARCRVLEIGCGTGGVVRVLNQVCRDGTVIGLDLFSEGLIWARKRSASYFVRASLLSRADFI